jgi:hypothetical protein
MIIELEPWGGIVVRWWGVDAWLLVDGTLPEAWFVWRGKPVRRWTVGVC